MKRGARSGFRSTSGIYDFASDLVLVHNSSFRQVCLKEASSPVCVLTLRL
jgi:hypothetical protein